jgi:hypothetical protein
VLRLETTINNVSAFKHHRKVERRRRPSTRRIAPVKKPLSCPFVRPRRLLRRTRALDQVTRPRGVDGKTVKPINFFNRTEQNVLHALQSPASGRAAVAACSHLAEKVLVPALA